MLYIITLLVTIAAVIMTIMEVDVFIIRAFLVFTIAGMVFAVVRLRKSKPKAEDKPRLVYNESFLAEVDNLKSLLREELMTVAVKKAASRSDSSTIRVTVGDIPHKVQYVLGEHSVLITRLVNGKQIERSNK